MDKGLALEDILREVHKFVMRSKWHTVLRWSAAKS